MSRTFTKYQNNADYQRHFAQSLVRTLGYHGAVRACQENLWHGVLDALDREKRPPN